MTRSIQTQDFNKIVKNRTQAEIITEQFQSSSLHIRGQIENMLLTNNVVVTASIRQLCNTLFTLGKEERTTFLNNNWGPLYTQKVEPLFNRLDSLAEDYTRMLGANTPSVSTEPLSPSAE